MLMGRPFTEFVHEQLLPWRDGCYGGARPELSSRVLSLDEGSGASSLLLRYPPGWTRSDPEVVTADEEIFVLEGSLTIGARTYSPRTYAFLPAGHLRESASSPTGALVLTFFSSEPRSVRDPSEGDITRNTDRLVEYVNVLDGPWGGNFHPLFTPGAGRKWLRDDPVTHEQTWILGTMPLRHGSRVERHPVVEEMFLLAGQQIGPHGKMHPGCYFWRPPGEPHGPFGSLTGNLMIMRTLGGPLSTVYDEEEIEFDWEPAHRPVVPPELSACGADIPYGQLDAW
jgi:hypothetical protein